MSLQLHKLDLVEFVAKVKEACVSWGNSLDARVLSSALCSSSDSDGDGKFRHTRDVGDVRLKVVSPDHVRATLIISERVGRADSFLPVACLEVHAVLQNDHFGGWLIDRVQVASAAYRKLGRFFERKTLTELQAVGEVVDRDDPASAPPFTERRPVW